MKGQTLDKWNSKPWRSSVFDGRPILKTPVDLWLFTELIQDVKPSVIVELGVYRGGFTEWLLHLTDLKSGERGAAIIGVDLDLRDIKPHSRATFIEGDSIGQSGLVASAIESFRAERPVIIILDDDHDPDHVVTELVEYSTICRPGDWIVVCDTVPVDGLEAAVADWLDHDGAAWGFKAVEIDRFGLSNNRGGWLRKGE